MWGTVQWWPWGGGRVMVWSIANVQPKVPAAQYSHKMAAAVFPPSRRHIPPERTRVICRVVVFPVGNDLELLGVIQRPADARHGQRETSESQDQSIAGNSCIARPAVLSQSSKRCRIRVSFLRCRKGSRVQQSTAALRAAGPARPTPLTWR